MKSKMKLGVLFLGVMLMFFSCQGGEENEGEILTEDFGVEVSLQSADTVAPIIDITSPTGAGGYTTQNSSIVLAGSASDNTGVKSVSWKNLKNDKKGKAQGTTEWTTPPIPLGKGDNIIKVTAKDLAGNKTVAQIVVTRNPNLKFLSTLQATPAGLFVNESTQVIFRIAIQNNPKLDQKSVKVVKVDDKNKAVGDVVKLYDDGDVDNGDDIASDGVFSGKVQLLESTEGAIRVRVIAKVKTKTGSTNAYSEVLKIPVVTHISDSQFNQALNMADATQDKYDELLATHSEEEAKNLTVAWLKSQAGVSQAGIAESGNGIWYVLDSGILGGILLNPEGTEGGRVGIPKRPLIEKRLNYKPDKVNLGSAKSSAVSAEISNPTIGSKNVLVIAPFNWQWKSWGTAFEETVYNMLKNSVCPDFDVTKIYDAGATVEVFKTLADYGAVILHTHGDAFYNLTLHKNFPSLDDLFAKPFGKVVFLTGELATLASKANYELDLKTGRLAIIAGYYAITPAFVSFYNQSLPDSLIYNGSCRGMYNNSMGNAFLGNGAKTYFGFSEYVLSVYDRNIALVLFDSLINKGKSAGEAFNDAIVAHGASDGQGAYFKMLGSSDLLMGKTGVNNGDFELGNLNGWVGLGDARVISQLGPLDPTEGSYMSIISTGLGSVNDSNSYLFQTFCIPTGVTTLSFDYNVVSEEPMEWVGTIFDDKFEVTLTTPDGIYQLAYESINSSTWIPIDGIDFYGGDSTTYETGWKHISYNVSAWATENCSTTLTFHTWDQGDSIYDTAAIIDNVKLK